MAKKKTVKRPRKAPKKSAKKSAKKAAKKPLLRGAAPKAALEAAPQEPCVDRPQAEDIVFDCAGGVIDVETQLGDMFPNPTEREKFCRCVSNKSGVPRDKIPCSGGNTIEDVIEAITC